MELVAVNKEIEATKAQFNAYVEKTNKLCEEALAITVTNDEQARQAITLGGAAKAILKEIDARRKETTAGASAFIEAVNGMCKILTEPLKQAEAATKQKVGEYQAALEIERRRQEEAARRAAAELQEKLRRETEEANQKALEEAKNKAAEEIRLRREQEAAGEAIRLKAEETRRKMIAFENETSDEELAAETKRLTDEAAGKKAQADATLSEEIAAAQKAAEEKAKAEALKAPLVLPPIIPIRPPARTESGALAYQVKSWKFEIVDADIIPRQFLTVDEKKIREAVDLGLRDIQGVRIYETVETRIRNRKAVA